MQSNPIINDHPSVWAHKCPDGSVEIYEDPEGKKVVKVFAFYQSDRPDMQMRYITLNQSSWRLRWVK